MRNPIFTKRRIVWFVFAMILIAVPQDSYSLSSSIFSFRGRPVKIRVSSEKIQVVQTSYETRVSKRETKTTTTTTDDSDWLPLEEYMVLPASQYACVPMPFNSSLTRIYGSEKDFLLVVPKISFPLPNGMCIEVVPEVTASVQVNPTNVRILSNHAKITGSPFIERFHLNDCFDFQVEATLSCCCSSSSTTMATTTTTTTNTTEKQQLPSNTSSLITTTTTMDDNNEDTYSYQSEEDILMNSPTLTNHNLAFFNNNNNKNKKQPTPPRKNIMDSSTPPKKANSIRSYANIEVDVYPPGKLRLIPRRLLEPIGNMAMSVVLNLLLEEFSINLGKDYEKWATDPDYRRLRTQLSEAYKLEQQDPVLPNETRQVGNTNSNNPSSKETNGKNKNITGKAKQGIFKRLKNRIKQNNR